MKKQFKLLKQISVIAIITVLFSACKKDEDNTPKPTPQPTKTDILTGSDWVMKSVIVDGSDIFSLMDECEKDGFTKFKSNGVYIDDEGALKCNSSDEQTSEGVWKFISNESQLLIDNLDSMNIELLTTDSLKVSITYDDDGTDKTIKTTFVAK
jgi:hypothetical protein